MTQDVGAATRRATSIVLWLAVALFVAEACFLFLFRQINQDEGWYLWAGKLVYEGEVPYRDFAFPQSPLLPYIYGAFQRLLGPGLYQGRLTTLLIAILNLILGIRLARRLGGRGAILTFLLLQLSTLTAAAFQLAYTAPYALATCLLTLSILCALSDLPETPRNILAVGLWALATGTRLSVAAAVVPLGLYLVLTSRRRWQAALVVLLSTALALGIIFGPFLLAGRDVVLYDILGFHTDRMQPEWQLGAMRQSVLNFVGDFPVPFALGCAGLVLWTRALWRASERRRTFWRLYPGLTVGLIVLALLVAHLVPRTTDSFYNSLQMPLLSVLGGLVLAWAWRALRGRSALRQVAWAALVAIVLLNAVQQATVMLRRGLVAWPPVNQVELARDAARYLQEHTPPGSRILTFNNFLALEADRDIPPGFEMSVFAYQPTWSTEKARRYGVINNELLLDAMRSGSAAAAFSDFDLEFLYGDRDELLRTLQEEFRWAKTVPGLGPARDNLRIYLSPQYGRPNPETALVVGLEAGITFLGYDLQVRSYAPGETIPLVLYWQARGDQRRSFTVFTHILDPRGVQVGGWDNPPCRGTCPTDTWRDGEVIRDEYFLATDPEWLPGEYTVEVGMYDPNSGQRLQVTDAGEDRIVLGTVTIG